MMLRILLVIVLSMSFPTVLAEKSACNIGCVPGTNAHIKRRFIRADIIVSGKLEFQGNSSVVKKFDKSYIPISLDIDAVYKGSTDSNQIEILVSNAVLNSLGTEHSRGQVASKLNEFSKILIEDMESYKAQLSKDNIDIKKISSSYFNTVTDLKKLSVLLDMYNDTYESLENRELVIYPNIRYIFFLNSDEDKIVLINMTDEKNTYEYSEETVKFIKSIR